MIFFIVKKYHEYTISNYLQTWARDLIGKVAVATYEGCAYATRLHRGTYVFTDFERIAQPQLDLAKSLERQIDRAGWRILNRPSRVLNRYELQKKLRENGINDFRVYRPQEDLSQVKFPVFVRRISEHMGAVGGLIETHDALRAELNARLSRGETDLIVVEKLDIKDNDGLCRKYGLFRAAEHFVPRHVYFSAQWLQNKADVIEPAQVAEEGAYIDNDPHRAEIRRVFEIANTDYGRADYGVYNGRVQVWEINTNPMMMAAPYRIDGRRLAHLARGTARMTQAVALLDDGTPYEPDRAQNWLPIEIEPLLQEQLGLSALDQTLRSLGRGLGVLTRLPGVKEIVNTCQRAVWLARQ